MLCTIFYLSKTVFKNGIVWFFVFFLFFGALFGQNKNFSQYKLSVKPTISSSAGIHQKIQNGTVSPAEQFFPLSKNPLPAKTEQVFISSSLIGSATDAINYDDDGTLNGGASIPPDNSGCVGPNHFLIGVNQAVQWYTKARVQQHSQTLNNFFSATSPATGLFDPKVLYDQYNDRYVIISDEEDDNSKTSNIHLAVSQTNDPNDGWYFQKINTMLTIGSTDTWLDYPGLGVSSEAIYVAGNMFDFNNNFVATRLWIIDKGLYSGGTSGINVYDPSTEAGLSSQAFTLQPAHMYGIQPSGVGTFLFSTEWDDGNGNDDEIGVFRVDDPLGSSTGPSFNVQFLNPGQIHDNSNGVPDAPQNGGTYNIDFSDTRAQSCVWRSDHLVGAFTVNPPSGDDAGQATAFWFDVNTTTLSSLTLAQNGNIGGEDIATAAATGYPAVGINVNGAIAVGFSASASTIYCGAYYALHNPGDAAGTVGGSQTLHAGTDYYLRTFSPYHILRNRWGDYSSLAVDPADDLNFWVFNQYAMTRSPSQDAYNEDGRWATVFGNFGSIDVPDYLYADNMTPTSLQLHWQGTSAEFRLMQDGSQIYAGSDTFFTVNGLTAATSYTFDVYGKASGQNYYSAQTVNLQLTTPPVSGDNNPTEIISSTPEISSGGGTSEFEIKNSGTWLSFPSGTSAASGFTSAKKTGDPGTVGSLPSGITKIATDCNWTLSASGGGSVGTYTIRFDLSGVSGISSFNTIKILKRDNASSVWQKVEDLGAAYSYNQPYITVSGLTSFSDFVPASLGDNSLPVELTSFTATQNLGSVLLKWHTESEIENRGFIIQRSADNGRSYQQIAGYDSLPSLKGLGSASFGRDYSFIDDEVTGNRTYWYKLIDVDFNGTRSEQPPVEIYIATGRQNIKRLFSENLPQKFKLEPNFPNPFNPSTTIRFAIPVLKKAVAVTLEIFDLQGRKIKSLYNGYLTGGIYSIQWDGTKNGSRKLASGMFIYLLKAGRFSKSGKMLLLR